jgi:lauroyl/myristoyl acyltransferase
MVRQVERGGVVGIAFDGRGGTRFRRTRWLGRPSLLSTGPWRLAARRGAPVVPAVVRPGRPHRLWLAPPIRSGEGRDPEGEGLMEAALAAVEPVLRADPAAYVPWLVHCRRRAAIDDHPLFVDPDPASQGDSWPEGAP